MIGVAEAVAKLRKRELSAEGLVRWCLTRIAEREPEVQAWEVIDAEGALSEARRIDALRDRPALHGLPVGVKDLIDTADLPTTYGSALYRGHQPERDADCVRRLREAGAIVLGKTVTTEFAVYSPGKTRNPRDPNRTPGGSSSGSAAAVADGMIPAALGTQTAGSIVRPASYCGVIGFKPTYGLLSMEGIHPLAPSLDTLGFYVQALEDVPLLLSALSGTPPAEIALQKPRLGLCRTEAWRGAEPSTQRLVEDAARNLGARDVELGSEFEGLVDAQIAIMGAEASRALGKYPLQGANARFRQFLDEGASVTAERLQAAHDQARRCKVAIDRIFDSFDALLTPAANGEAPVGLSATGDPLFARIWTLLGTPCVSLPVLTGPAGMPVGLQVVGSRGREGTLLSAAKWISDAL